jgi:hypothetical protein
MSSQFLLFLSVFEAFSVVFTQSLSQGTHHEESALTFLGISKHEKLLDTAPSYE